MPLSRRSIILGASGVGLALVGGGAAWRVMRTPTTAIAPWTIDPRRPADPRLDALRYAILAPNPHNRQPWLIELVGSDRVLLRCDLDKRLPETDPFDRQIIMGFGTFIEVARIAAAERGYAIDVTPFPAGEPQPRLDQNPVAQLVFRKDPDITHDPLFSAITHRHTNRALYAPAPPTPAQLRAVARENVVTSADPALLAQMRPLAVRAMTIETVTHRTFMESVDLMRIGADEMNANPDGLPIGGPIVEALQAVGMLNQKLIADPNTDAFKMGLKQVQDSCGSIPALLWITTPGNSRAEQLEAGRRYVRAQLRATTLGLAMHPLSQSLQEYPEMTADYARVHRLLGASGSERVQMLARIGTAPPTLPAPRWPLEKHLV
ncbi:hypothetical protein [Sphingomonas sp. 28-62-20]|uniref:Acg family FMN-binding oxidoreductase n=1 Tax=Sphingomonas sp. 28-62-20 TaxID=1970433 RepID=UPI0026D92B79